MLTMVNEQRRSVRMEMNKGAVVVRYNGVPAFKSTLVDISEDGCRCRAILDGLEKTEVEFWRIMLAQGGEILLQIELTVAPELVNFHCEAEVIHVHPTDCSFSLGLRFVLPDAQRSKLRSALVSIAAAKCLTGAGHADERQTGSTQSEEKSDSLRSDTTRRFITGIFSRRRKESSVRLNTGTRISSRSAVGSSACQLLLQHRRSRPTEVCQALAKECGLPIAPLAECDVPQKLQKLFSYLVLRRYEFIPFAESKERLCIAAAHPLAESVINELEQICKQRIMVYLAPIDSIQQIQIKMRPRGPYQERHHSRVRVRIPATYRFIKSDRLDLEETPREGILLNISEGGFLILGPAEPFEPVQMVDSEASLYVEFTTESQNVIALCRVRHVTAFKQPPSPQVWWSTGVEITQMNPEDCKVLKSVCADAAIELMKKRSTVRR